MTSDNRGMVRIKARKGEFGAGEFTTHLLCQGNISVVMMVAPVPHWLLVLPGLGIVIVMMGRVRMVNRIRRGDVTEEDYA